MKVEAKSDIAIEFFNEMKSIANPADGSVTLPSDMLYWEPGNSGNILPRIRGPLRLQFIDWNPIEDITPPPRPTYWTKDTSRSDAAEPLQSPQKNMEENRLLPDTNAR